MLFLEILADRFVHTSSMFCNSDFYRSFLRNGLTASGSYPLSDDYDDFDEEKKNYMSVLTSDLY